MPNLGGWEWVILLVVAVLLFGGSRLAGIGKSAGQAIREFKEEVSSPEAEAPKAEPKEVGPAAIDSPASEPTSVETTPPAEKD
jgi:sec-independent protein translocase protein TatA